MHTFQINLMKQRGRKCVYACVCVYACNVYVCVRARVCVCLPQQIRRGQRTTSNVGLCLPSCLRQDLIFLVLGRLLGPQTLSLWEFSGIHTPFPSGGMLGFQRHGLLCPALQGCWGIQTQARVANALPKDQAISPAPRFPFSTLTLMTRST